MITLKAYLNNPELKAATVKAMEADIAAERLVQGHYWDGVTDTGCFVGCIIRGTSHKCFETKLGIPHQLARLADSIFEGLSYPEAKQFSVDFLGAIPVGADLNSVWPKFALFLLVDPAAGMINFAGTEEAKNAIKVIASLYAKILRDEIVEKQDWQDAADAADAAAAAAPADTATAAAATAAATATDTAAAAAATAATAAVRAARTAYVSYVAYIVYASADAATHASTHAATNVRSRYYSKMAAVLIGFLKEAV